MAPNPLKRLPYLLCADAQGRIYDHPYYRMAGFGGAAPTPLGEKDLIPLPLHSKLFYIPDCPPIGLDPATGRHGIVRQLPLAEGEVPCFAVAAFPEPGFVRTHLPAADYAAKRYRLPMWAYTAVGFKNDRYYTAAFQVEYSARWDPANYDDRELLPAIRTYPRREPLGPLGQHLVNCATRNHCFAAKNLFLERWEAPLPVSRTCNASCLGCLSLQPDDSCAASHHRLDFRPSKEEIVELAVRHLEKAPQAIVSFGQGCEGEPLTEYRLMAASIRAIRARTSRGTINLNTNGSWPRRVQALIEAGLDSIRISLNSARPEYYHAYYRPRGYTFNDVTASIALARRRGIYTMINYLVFPGITDQADELTALEALIARTGVQFVHLKNLNIDPEYYLAAMPDSGSPAMGIKRLAERLKAACPEIQLGYFNQAVR